MSVEVLFRGKGDAVFGGLSNEEELGKLCPPEFKSEENPWTQYASILFYLGSATSHWKWRTNDPVARRHQRGCLEGLIGSCGLRQEDKEAVGGWMLSEMLEEVPKHIPTTDT